MSSVQGLNQRTQGWLRFIWGKATTQDDWSRSGEPLPIKINIRSIMSSLKALTPKI